MAVSWTDGTSSRLSVSRDYFIQSIIISMLFIDGLLILVKIDYEIILYEMLS